MNSKKTELKQIEIVVEHVSRQDMKQNQPIQLEKQDQIKPSKQGLAVEVNGPKGLEPTRYGDWEAKGRCYDF